MTPVARAAGRRLQCGRPTRGVTLSRTIPSPLHHLAPRARCASGCLGSRHDAIAYHRRAFGAVASFAQPGVPPSPDEDGEPPDRRMRYPHMARSSAVTLVITTLGLLAAACGGSTPPRPEPAPVATSIAIVGATLWDGTGRAPVPNAVTLVRERSDPLRRRRRRMHRSRRGSRVIDAQGQYLIPGLIDSHVHLLFLTRGSAGEELGLDLRDLLAQGITTVRDMGTDPAGLLARVRSLQAAPTGARHAARRGPPVLLQRVPRHRHGARARSTASRRRWRCSSSDGSRSSSIRTATRRRSSPRRARRAPWDSSSTRSWIPARSGGSPMRPTAPGCRSGATRGSSPRA